MPDDPNLNQNPMQFSTPSNGDDSSVQAPQAPQTPQAPVSNPAREAAPFYSEQPKSNDNFIEVSEKEPEIKPEVESAGVYKVSDKIKIDQEARDAGVTEAKESTNVVTTPTGKVSLPMSSMEADRVAKESPSNSSTWLAAIIQLFFKKLGGSNAR